MTINYLKQSRSVLYGGTQGHIKKMSSDINCLATQNFFNQSHESIHEDYQIQNTYQNKYSKLPKTLNDKHQIHHDEDNAYYTNDNQVNCDFLDPNVVQASLVASETFTSIMKLMKNTLGYAWNTLSNWNQMTNKSSAHQLVDSKKAEYTPYSSQSYQLGDFDYEILVFRKPHDVDSNVS